MVVPLLIFSIHNFRKSSYWIIQVWTWILDNLEKRSNSWFIPDLFFVYSIWFESSDGLLTLVRCNMGKTLKLISLITSWKSCSILCWCIIILLSWIISSNPTNSLMFSCTRTSNLSFNSMIFLCTCSYGKLLGDHRRITLCICHPCWWYIVLLSRSWIPSR